MIFDDPLTRKRVFSGLWGSPKQPKIGPESLLAPNLAPKASWRPLGLDFWTLWGSQNGPPRRLESKLEFEAFFEVFLKLPSKGRRQEAGPSGRGLLGSLPTVDAGLLRSCACHSAFGIHISLRSRPPLEPERLSGRISSGPAAPNRPLSLRCCAHLSRSGRKGSFGK